MDQNQLGPQLHMPALLLEISNPMASMLPHPPGGSAPLVSQSEDTALAPILLG